MTAARATEQATGASLLIESTADTSSLVIDPVPHQVCAPPYASVSIRSAFPTDGVAVLASLLVDFELSPEHELLRRTIRDFLQREVVDQIDEHEQNRRFPTDIVA